MDLASKANDPCYTSMSVMVDPTCGGMRVLGGASPLVPVRDTTAFRTSHKEELNYAPAAPKNPPTPALRRYESAPMSQKSPGQRRSIFGKELGICQRPFRTPPPSPLPRKRATSISVIPHHQEEEEDHTNMSLLAMMSRPKSETRLEERPHFCDLTDVPEELLEQLPLLPSPLARFHDGKRCQYLGGMYPLTQPEPILRHKESVGEASESSTASSSTGFEDGLLSGERNTTSNAIHPSPPPPPIPPPAALNLTKSARYIGPRQDRKPSCGGADDTSSTASGSMSSSVGGPKIRFDPRVTVTEFEDDPEYRQWFSDFELEKFKKETIALAQQYLVKHPTVLEDYCKPYLDPVTGTFRKKALFSMLVLKATRAEDSLDEIQSESSQKRYDIMRKDLADQNFKRILIVNRNKLVVDLFQRSLAKIFPKAQFTRCETGHEALKMATETRGGTFDLILAEDRSHRPWKSCDGLESGAAAADAKDQQEESFSTVSKTASLGGVAKCHKNTALLVTDLFRMIRGLERLEKRDQAMLVAVSTNPEANRAALQASGTDAIWGLPPPHMSDELRDELVARLVQKRRGDPPNRTAAFRVPCHPQE